MRRKTPKANEAATKVGKRTKYRNATDNRRLVEARRPPGFSGFKLQDLEHFARFWRDGLQQEGTLPQKFGAVTGMRGRAAERGFDKITALVDGDLIVRTVSIGGVEYQCSSKNYALVANIFENHSVVSERFSLRAELTARSIFIFLGALDSSLLSLSILPRIFPDFKDVSNRFIDENERGSVMFDIQNSLTAGRTRDLPKGPLPPWIDHRSDEAQKYIVPEHVPTFWIKKHDQYAEKKAHEAASKKSRISIP